MKRKQTRTKLAAHANVTQPDVQSPVFAPSLHPPASGVTVYDDAVQSLRITAPVSCAPIQRARLGTRSGSKSSSKRSPPKLSKTRRSGKGLPDDLRKAMETMSGYALDDVRVHRNSLEPQKVQAHAFAKGHDIHLAPGQDAHLAHEAWHVVQQAQGRVRPTGKIGGHHLNESATLEREATLMGAKAQNFHHRGGPGVAAPDRLAQTRIGAHAASVQRLKHKLKKGETPQAHWTLIGSKGSYNIYEDGDDGTAAGRLKRFKRGREQAADIDLGALSDAEESDTELDYLTNSKKGQNASKVYRVNNLRDTAKVVRRMRDHPDQKIGIRWHGEDILRATPGRHQTQFLMSGATENALVQSDGTQGTGARRKRLKTGPQPLGRASDGTYKQIFSELRLYSDKDVGQAIYDKLSAGKDYPAFFSPRARTLMNQAGSLIQVFEPYRSNYAWLLAAGAIRALRNGQSLETIFYKGAGQADALHPGTSSSTVADVSGQLMQQNLGFGENRPHPSGRKTSDLTGAQWFGGVERQAKLFDFAGPGIDPHVMFQTDFLDKIKKGSAPSPAGSVVPKIDQIVASERKPGTWNAAKVVRLHAGKSVKVGQTVSYKNTDYLVSNITPSGFVFLN